MDEKNYYKRINSFYDRTDEKEIVSAYLKAWLQNKYFNSVLDIGAGTGVFSSVFQEHSKTLTLIEKDEAFFKSLKKQFKTAQCIHSTIENHSFTQSYDLIFLSHVLYYIPTKDWGDLLKTLLSKLNQNGSLIVVMNTDSGDWWNILQHFYKKYQDHLPFDYTPLSEFKYEFLNQNNVQLRTIPYIYRVYFESAHDLNKYIHNILLGINDASLKKELRNEISEFTYNNFIVEKSLRYLNWHAEMWIIQNC
ncbi:MAG TPA: class I SAM-dependent methyltransferase [Oligoflexia bacterium]|nr:class I SAM-dependent methyltransferase [Oligoflexia bacterium]HMR24634.1 class I SAM-dependent methyltransferase [Oligoflexia bacterium]